MATTPLVRSQSAPQPIASLSPTASTSKGAFIQRSASHQNVDNGYVRRQVAAQTTKSRQGAYLSSLSTSPGDPFNLSGFFPTSLSAIGNEEEEWQWLWEGGEGKREERQRYRGGEEGAVKGGRSAIFGEETSDTIRGEDKMGVLSLKDVSLFSGSAGEYGRLLSPYTSDDVVDENSLYLAQRARREQSVMSAVGGEGGYGEVFLAE